MKWSVAPVFRKLRSVRRWALPAVLGIFLIATAIAGWWHRVPPVLAMAFVALVALLAIFAVSRMAEPDRHSAREHAWVSVAYTLLLTWSTAAAVMFGFDAWASADARKTQGLLALLLLVAPNVGGVLALTRSVRTRSETGATLRELSTIRVATLSTPVIEESVRAFEAKDVEQLVASVARMLRLTVSLPLAREVLDEGVLWVCNARRREWFILASSDPPGTDLSFTMPVLTEVTPKGGIVANLALRTPPGMANCFFGRDVFLCRSDLDEHPWYLPNRTSTARAMAAVLLRDGSDVIGVLSLTTRRADVVPISGPQCGELVDVMSFWSA